MAGKRRWIQGAIKHPGRMKNLARKHGVSTRTEMERDKNKGGSLGRAARMGLTLEKMHGGKRGKKRSTKRKSTRRVRRKVGGRR